MTRLGLIAMLAACQVAAADPAVWHFAPGPDTDVWLLGSVHYLRDSDHPLPDSIERVYATADTLVMEIDLDDLDASTVQLSFLQAALLTPPATLASVVGAELYATTATTAAAVGLDMAAVDGFEPWFVALTVMDLGMARLGFRADQGLEQSLLQRAARDRKPVLGLESVADQLEIFDSLPPPEQQALLEQTLGELESGQAEMNALLDAWRNGSLEDLGRELLTAFDAFPMLYQSLVVERNRRWIEGIERLAAQPGRFLIVVGALHLVGDSNVIDLLADEGYTIARVAN